jgi:hypothetical protein
MGKQLELTEKEQKRVSGAIMAISEILLLKIDKGVERPELEGILNIDNEDREVIFSITAQKKGS